MKTQLMIALRFLLVMTVLTGIAYPLAITGIALVSYPSKANGSLIMREGKIIGSELIGQKFDSSAYFWSRPSATDYNSVPSGAYNYGPVSDTLKKLIDARRISFASKNYITDISKVPQVMLFGSASGLDPHIPPEAALVQVSRIAEERHFNSAQKEQLIKRIKDLTEPPQFHFLGEKRINVLILNMELDKIR